MTREIAGGAEGHTFNFEGTVAGNTYTFTDQTTVITVGVDEETVTASGEFVIDGDTLTGSGTFDVQSVSFTGSGTFTATGIRQ